MGSSPFQGRNENVWTARAYAVNLLCQPQPLVQYIVISCQVESMVLGAQSRLNWFPVYDLDHSPRLAKLLPLGCIARRDGEQARDQSRPHLIKPSRAALEARKGNSHRV
jgi:hypothetical protein